MSSELEDYLGLFKLTQCDQKFLKSRRKRQRGGGSDLMWELDSLSLALKIEKKMLMIVCGL